MTSGLTRGLERSASREQASIEMGRILVNPEADFAHIGDHFLRNRGGGALANLEHNSVAGIIGILDPVIFDTGSGWQAPFPPERSEEHTSELQSRPHLVCRLLLEKKT